MEFNHVHSPDGLNNTLLSQGCVPGNSFLCGNDGQNVHSKDRGEGEVSLIACVQLTGQTMVILLGPPTII